MNMSMLDLWIAMNTWGVDIYIGGVEELCIFYQCEDVDLRAC